MCTLYSKARVHIATESAHDTKQCRNTMSQYNGYCYNTSSRITGIGYMSLLSVIITIYNNNNHSLGISLDERKSNVIVGGKIMYKIKIILNKILDYNINFYPGYQ